METKSKSLKSAGRQENRDLEMIDLERSKVKRPKPHPTLTQNLFLRIVMFWVGDIVKKGNKKTWTQEMNYDLPPYDQATSHKDQVKKAIKKNPSFVLAILSCYKLEVFYLAFSMVITA